MHNAGHIVPFDPSVLQIRIFNSSGATIGNIDTPGLPTNVAFGGNDSQTLYVTSREPGSLSSVHLAVPGRSY